LFIGEIVGAWADARVFQNGHWKFENAEPGLRSIHSIAGSQFYVIGEPLIVPADGQARGGADIFRRVAGVGNGVEGLKPVMIARRCERYALFTPTSAYRAERARPGAPHDRATRSVYQSGETPRELGYALHRAPVRAGKLRVRVTRAALETLISVAAKSGARDCEEERALGTLVRYLEGLEDRFDPGDDGAEAPSV
jgi:hypothetical protein